MLGSTEPLDGQPPPSDLRWMGALKAVDILAWVLLSYAATSVVWEILILAFCPVSLSYGEGLLAWMAQSLKSGVSPYGDILAVPSLNSCYGPLAPMLTIPLSWFVPAPEGLPGLADVFSGRLVVFFAWIIVGCSLFQITPGSKLTKATASVLVPFMFSGGVFLFAFRIDPVLCALESLLLLVWAKPPSPAMLMKYLPPLLGSLIAATKPTALWEILAVFFAARLISGAPTPTWKSLSAVMSSGLSMILILQIATGGWFLNNIIIDQGQSGWLVAGFFSHNLKAIFFSPQGVVVVVSFFIFVARSAGQTGAVVLLVSTACICGLLCFKAGSDINYFMPLMLVLAPIMLSGLGRLGLAAPFAIFLAVSMLPFKTDATQEMRMNAKRTEMEVAKVVDALRSKPTLSDDAFYYVAGQLPPVASDFFQLASVYEKKSKTLEKILKYSDGRAWGGWRITKAIQKAPEKSAAIPMPVEWNREAALRVGVDGRVVPRISEKASPSDLLIVWVKCLLLPSIFAVLLSRKRWRPS